MKSNLLKLLSCFLFITTALCEYRSINGQGNNKNNPSAGTPGIPFVRTIPSTSHYADANNNLLNTPGNYNLIPGPPLDTCSATLLNDVFPLPRCVSNILMSKQLKDDDMYDLSRLEKFKSKRGISHILTYWGLFVKMDVSSGFDVGQPFPKGIFIPKDDQLYLSSYKYGLKPSNFTLPTATVPFNRSMPDGGNTGINEPSSFVDGTTLYGRSDADLQLIRDIGNNGKMRMEKDPATADGQFGYPPVDAVGNFMYGYCSEFGRNVFTDFFYIIFLREHNRLCDELFAIHGNDWDDETYFQEARKWVIAFIQKITYYEYLGTALGIPLPQYDGYKPDIEPSINTFFSTVTYRYGHSEISDFYTIVNDQGEPLTSLSLNDIEDSRLIKLFGAPLIGLSLALERQDEVDIYSGDLVRNYRHKAQYMDISSADTVRGRDHGIPSYNNARAAFGLKRKTTWESITSDPDIQKRLQDTYGTIDRVEALMGGLAEDHVNGGNFGELFYKSFSDEWIKIRAMDRFWYENQDAGFSKDDIKKIQNTTLLDILKRNTPESSYFPQNLWFVQPPASTKKLDNDVGEYNSPLSLSNDYIIQWKIDSSNVTFLITMSSVNAWFGIGFNPTANAMTDTDMMIFQNTDQGVTGMNYLGIGLGIKPKDLPNDQVITILSQKVEDGVTRVEVTRPIDAANRKSLGGNIEMVYAWNPTSNIITYHGGNRGTRMINLQSGATSDADARKPGLIRMHGIAMFLMWGVLIPSSVWIVRYLRHKDSYMVQHRNLSLFSGLIVGLFAAVAFTTTTAHATSSHAIMGITITTTIAIQISLGILAIWSLENVESASTGIVRYLKHLHFYLGAAVLLLAWTNIYLGMITYDQKFGGNKGLNKPFIWAYVAWLLIIGFVITASEFYYKIKNMQFLWPTKKTDDITKRLRKCIPDDVYENLPIITWEEFNKRIMTGANLVVAEGLVFDIHKWIPLHPGGQKILQRVIGTDVTNDFFFDPIVKTVLQNNFDVYNVENPSISALTDDTYKELTSKVNKSRPHNVANAVDMINAATSFKNRRVAMHRHSKFATSKLASMVIARILESEYHSKTRSINEKLLQIPQSPKFPQFPQLSSHIFRRYILTNIEIVTRPNAEHIVKKLTFQVIHPNDSFPKFFPGDYIEVMSYANNHVVIRPYTPLRESNENSFSILVKIYKDGVMSQHLNKQLKNFEVKVRGPFDLGERMALNFPKSLKSLDNPTRPSSPTVSTFGRVATYQDFTGSVTYLQPDSKNNEDSNIPGGRSGILLNKEREDLCWDCLFMVCGGTGITPMLQLIQYHMDNAKSSFTLYLLAACDRIDDLIYPKYLDYLYQTLKGKLEIKYILFKPPKIWRDYSGLIDDSLLFDWIRERYTVPPPAVPPKFSGYSSGISNNNLNVVNTVSFYSNSNMEIPMQEQYNQQYDTMLSPIQVPNSVYPHDEFQPSTSYHTSQLDNAQSQQIMLMNERHNYMKLFARDNSKQVRLVVCGTSQFNENIRTCLEKIGFPNEKALFIN